MSAMAPCAAVRIGAPAMTSRGLKEDDFKQIGDFLQARRASPAATRTSRDPRLADFLKALKNLKKATKPPAAPSYPSDQAWAGKERAAAEPRRVVCSRRRRGEGRAPVWADKDNEQEKTAKAAVKEPNVLS